MLKFLTILIFLYTGNLFASCENALDVKITYHDITTRSVGLSEDANYAKFTFLSSSDKAITIDKVLLKSKGDKIILENISPAYINPFGKKEIIIGGLDTINIYAIKNGAYECEYGSKLDKLLVDKQINFNKKISNFKYEDIKIENKTFTYEKQKYSIDKNDKKNRITIKPNSKNNTILHTVTFVGNNEIIFSTFHRSNCNKAGLPSLIGDKCIYRYAVNGKNMLYTAGLRGRNSEQSSAYKQLGVYRSKDKNYIAGLYDFKSKKWLVKQNASLRNSDQYITNIFNDEKAEFIINEAFAAEKKSREHLLSILNMLDVARGVKSTQTSKENKAKNLFKKLRNIK